MSIHSYTFLPPATSHANVSLRIVHVFMKILRSFIRLKTLSDKSLFTSYRTIFPSLANSQFCISSSWWITHHANTIFMSEWTKACGRTNSMSPQALDNHIIACAILFLNFFCFFTLLCCFSCIKHHPCHLGHLWKVF